MLVHFESGVHTDLRRQTHAYVFLAFVLLWPVAGLADYTAGLEAAERGDFATAMREWRPLAEAV